MEHVFRIALGILISCGLLWGDGMAEVRKSGRLLYGGDQEGGGPYVYPSEKDPSQVTGFEIDLARRIGEYLNVEAVFTQGQWDRMPEMLRTGKIQLILNGYEFTPERAEAMDSTIPYYVYALQLMTRRGDARLAVWEDLKRPADGKQKRIGVLTGSAAEAYARKFCGTQCEVIAYDGTTDSMREVETGKLDATLQDTPAASFYAPRFPGLRKMGGVVERGYYVIYVKKGEAALLQSLNEAIDAKASDVLAKLVQGMVMKWLMGDHGNPYTTISDPDIPFALTPLSRSSSPSGTPA